MGLFGDSWASDYAKKTAGQLGTEAGTLFGEGQAERAQLLPFFRGELTASHAFTPTQLNEMLTAAGAGAGGAAGSLGGEASLAAARTGNTAALPALIDKINRAKTQGLAKANESIAGTDVAETLNRQQQGAAGMASLYGADTGDALRAMGLQQEAIANQIKASESGGWFSNLLGSLKDLSGTGLNAMQMAKMA
jgi:hypothetical protein